MRNLPLVLGILLGVVIAVAAQHFAPPVSAQGTVPLALGVVVSACGTPPTGANYTAGAYAPVTILAASGALCVNQ